jgi:multidrug efflux pump subunit AcrB
MIKYLISRPVSVFMTFTACFILGIIAYVNVPVSLLPDIAIPEITVQITGDNSAARALENTVVSPVRQQLMQIGKLRDIRSETRDGSAIVRLGFEYGTDTDLAFIEVNEKIDMAMNYIPKEIDRPRVIKASATDIPVLNLNLTLKEDADFEPFNEEKFLDLSEFAETVIKRRIEQLPQVAMVDIGGLAKKEVVIVPDNNLLEISGLTLADIESALNANNVEPGSMIIRDGYYEYNIKFSSVLRTTEDVQHIYIRKNDRIYQLKDLADVSLAAEKEKGMALYGGKRCVTLAVIKQSEENMKDLQQAVDGVLNNFRRQYPGIAFSVSQNQTELLDYTISNLQQNLILAFIFICLVSVFFLKDGKSPLVIGISMFVSLVVSLLFFYLFHVSLNVVSLTGLILALGMMIDNSIIVTDNIGQYMEKNHPIDEACILGTNEVIAPMLSSSLTTIAVFVPLIFLSGIAGAVFFDQAFSVTIGLLVSYATGIALLPVLYRSIYTLRRKRKGRPVRQSKSPAGDALFLKMYDRGIDWVFSHKTLTTVVMLAVFPVCFWLFTGIRKEKMPDINQRELLTRIEWNENIHVEENLQRSLDFLRQMQPATEEQSALAGQQQFLLNREREQTSTETEIYLRTASPENIPLLKKQITDWFDVRYPDALVAFSPVGTVFEKIFSTGEPDLVVECYAKNKSIMPETEEIHQLEKDILARTGEKPVSVAFQRQLNLRIDREKLLLFKVSYDEVYRALKSAFKENRFAMLRSYRQYLPVTFGGREESVQEVIQNTLVSVSDSDDGTKNRVSLGTFVHITPSEDIKTIIAGKAGEYIPLSFYGVRRPEQIVRAVREMSGKQTGWDVDFSGSFFSNRKMLGELTVILLISILLMYFILAAQFESFLQPLLVLLEIPIDVTFALALLMATGHSLNLMSAIGIVVTCGIIINDSILKVDVMNRLRREGLPLMAAIHEAGRRRLKAILMTSLTSIACMVPLLFSSDLGSELEKPLAVAMIGGMAMGTVVSLFVLPLAYWGIYRNKK